MPVLLDRIPIVARVVEVVVDAVDLHAVPARGVEERGLSDPRVQQYPRSLFDLRRLSQLAASFRRIQCSQHPRGAAGSAVTWFSRHRLPIAESQASLKLCPSTPALVLAIVLSAL